MKNLIEYVKDICFEIASSYEGEKKEMSDANGLRPDVEEKYLEVKLERSEITPEEDKKFDALILATATKKYNILIKEISNVGWNLDKFANENPTLLKGLLKGVTRFNPHRLNIDGKVTIYLDWQSFLHVFLRHVKEFEIGNQFGHKTKFLWKPYDVVTVMSKVIESIDEEIQDYFQKNPGKRFSKYGAQNLYFEGDYYTFHIEADGRVSTFHKSNEKIE